MYKKGNFMIMTWYVTMCTWGCVYSPYHEFYKRRARRSAEALMSDREKQGSGGQDAWRGLLGQCWCRKG